MDFHTVISSRKVFPLWQDCDSVYIHVGATTGIDEAYDMIAGRRRWARVRLLPSQRRIIGIDGVDLASIDIHINGAPIEILH